VEVDAAVVLEAMEAVVAVVVEEWVAVSLD
jgi:hypothetical protein